MESLPKACLQHPGDRQINYEAPNLLKKTPNPLPANSNEPLSLSFPSAYHLNHTIMPPLGTCTHSLTVFFLLFSQTSQLYHLPSQQHICPSLLSSITSAPFVAEMARIAPCPLLGSKWAILSCKHPPLDRRKKKRKKTCDLSLRSVPKTIAYCDWFFFQKQQLVY